MAPSSAASEHDELVLAEDIAKEVRRHGGAIVANFLCVGRPDLRKRLGDVKLLRFLRRFPEAFEVTAGPSGGHLVRCRDAGSACVAVPEPGGPARSAGQAAAGATIACGPAAANERAVHALRQLERELVRCLALASDPGQRGDVDRCSERERKVACNDVGRDVSWLLRNGKLRRKIGAVVRFLPVPALILRDATPDACEEEHASAPDAGAEPQAPAEEQGRHRCAVSGHARTLAGYLLQFLRDRPERFILGPSRSLHAVVFGGPIRCLYDDPACSCSWEVRLADGGVNLEVEAAAEEALLGLVARKISELGRTAGSLRVPLSRVGREREVHEALQGRSLLQLLEGDSDRRASQGLAARFRWDTHSSAYTVGLHEAYRSALGLDAQEEATAPAPGPARPRRPAGATAVSPEVLGEGPGVVAVLKPPGVTTEAVLEALQARYDRECPGERRIISVSRLDRDTSGVLVAATSRAGAECLTAQFWERKVSKRYLALCVGRLSPTCGEVNARLYISGFAEKYRAYVSPKGKEACTRYEVLGVFRRPSAAIPGDSGAPRRHEQQVEQDELATQLRHYRLLHGAAGACAGARAQADAEGDEAEAGDCFSLVACVPITGRTHQIRAHLSWRGHPLVADANYNPRGQVRRHFQWCPRLWLHCGQMRVRDLEGRELRLSAALPWDLRAVLEAELQPEEGDGGRMGAGWQQL